MVVCIWLVFWCSVGRSGLEVARLRAGRFRAYRSPWHMGKLTKVKTLYSIRMEKLRKTPYSRSTYTPSFKSNFHLFTWIPRTCARANGGKLGYNYFTFSSSICVKLGIIQTSVQASLRSVVLKPVFRDAPNGPCFCEGFEKNDRKTARESLRTTVLGN